MYLALFMTSESETALRHFAPDAPKNLHLTVVHVKGVRPVEAILYHEPSLPVECICLELDELGPPERRVRALLMDPTPLLDLRKRVEHLLIRVGISWSREWPFRPHVSVGRSKTVGEPPRSLTFDSVAWCLE